MITIAMKSWIASSQCSTMTLKTTLLLALGFIFTTGAASAQLIDDQQINQGDVYSFKSSANTQENLPDTIPEPREVMFKSARLPGWGQVVNEQTWKVPIVYGLLGGLGYYSYWVHDQYTDYRAAAYNANPENDDEKFGPTPPDIDPNQSESALRDHRDFLRNRRDLTFVLIVAAYGLNIVDAYVFAHLRDFDVSDDLSAGFDIKPGPDEMGNAGMTLSFTLNF